MRLSFGTGSSVVTKQCQVCGFTKLESVLFLGYLPPVNRMVKIGSLPEEQPSYPAELLFCPKCKLTQIGLTIDPKILFPASYPYTSSTTRILRENFTELFRESSKIIKFQKTDLIVDIGSNDGNLLINFKDAARVLGITPEDIGKVAIKRGIPTEIKYFNKDVVRNVIKKHGKAKVITATNVFAHIENINQVVRDIKSLLTNDGVFISESHYLFPLITGLQYDTIYHEHLRYYSLHSLKYLLEKHGLEIFHAKQIPTHGGSIRVYSARKGAHKISPTVARLLREEKSVVTSKKSLTDFKSRVDLTKLVLHNIFLKIKKDGDKIYGIGAPSRASTLINFVGINDGIVDCVMEISGSQKIGNYVPGTKIPIYSEDKLFKDQPKYVILFSWHIAAELMPKLREKGYKGHFIVPLPKPRIIK